MSYDIGIGRCAELHEDIVVVRLESVMVQRLSPRQPWQRSGTSLLRLSRHLCSTARPPQLEQELYIDHDALLKRSMALLDLLGDGATVTVDLRALLNDMDPQPAASSRGKEKGKAKAAKGSEREPQAPASPPEHGKAKAAKSKDGERSKKASQPPANTPEKGKAKAAKSKTGKTGADKKASRPSATPPEKGKTKAARSRGDERKKTAQPPASPKGKAVAKAKTKNRDGEPKRSKR